MDEIKVYAPVLIPTLCRIDHFSACVESLSKCTGASSTDLFIALDYPLKESHVVGHNEIKEYLKTVTGFRSINVIERTENYGYWRNYREALDRIFEKYDRFIFSEDDNVFSPNFLVFVNKGLEKYKDDTSVHSICGYSFPIDIRDYNYNIYSSCYYSAWGVGEWRHKQYHLTQETVSELLKSNRFCAKLLCSYPLILSALLSMVNKGDLYDDTTSTALSILLGEYNVFPKISKVRNMGHDGSGVHCGETEIDIFSTQTIDQSDQFDYDDCELEGIRIAALDKYFSLPFKSRLKLVVRFLKFRFKVR